MVTAEYAGGWSDIAYDTDGGAISANLNLSEDSAVRVTAAYGVSGACCLSFVSFPAKCLAESKLNTFINTQARICEEKRYHMVVSGDTKSYPQPTSDHIGGPTHARPECLASTLLALGFRDTFRDRHPTKRAQGQ